MHSAHRDLESKYKSTRSFFSEQSQSTHVYPTKKKFIVSNITAASDKAQIKNKQILCKTQMDEAKAEVKKRM